MAQISCENISIGYSNKEVQKEISFQVNAGEYLCIIGENGAGKSTLMKTMLGLQAPLSGKIVFGDGLKQTQIGYLPQQTEMQKDFPAIVSEIVISGCLARCGLRPFYNKDEKLLAEKACKKMQITELAQKSYRELSGGQQQRVLLARALCATQNLLLLDEPVTGLDPSASEKMYQTIEELNAADKITVIMISHDIPSAIKYASHILYMGERVFFGKTQKFLESEFGSFFAPAQTYKGGTENA